MKRSRLWSRLAVTADGRGMTGRAGTALLAEAAETIGLVAAVGAVSPLAGA